MPPSTLSSQEPAVAPGSPGAELRGRRRCVHLDRRRCRVGTVGGGDRVESGRVRGRGLTALHARRVPGLLLRQREQVSRRRPSVAARPVEGRRRGVRRSSRRPYDRLSRSVRPGERPRGPAFGRGAPPRRPRHLGRLVRRRRLHGRRPDLGRGRRPGCGAAPGHAHAAVHTTAPPRSPTSPPLTPAGRSTPDSATGACRPRTGQLACVAVTAGGARTRSAVGHPRLHRLRAPDGPAVLAAHFGRRATYTVLAAVLAADTVPAHALALCVPWPRRHRRGSGTTVRSRPFWSLRCAHPRRLRDASPRPACSRDEGAGG